MQEVFIIDFFFINDLQMIVYNKMIVVICGSGAVANVAAYTLTKNGWNDVLVLEQNTINSGTSNYSVGLIGLFKPSKYF